MSNETKQNQGEVPNIKQEGWNIDKVAEESTNKPSDEILRETLRGDEENKGNADEFDVVGGVDSNETPQGREEAKKDETRRD